MKKLFALALVAMSLLSFAPVASAQPYGTWAYCNGIYRFGNCNGPTQQQMQQQQQYRQPQYVQQPQYYNAQPSYPAVAAPQGFSNCTLVGALAGGTLGSLAHHHRGQAVILGAIVGGVAGNMLCTNSQGQRVYVPQERYREEFSNPPVNYDRRHTSQGVACTVKTGKGGEEAEETIQVVAPRECKKLGGYIDRVRTMGNEEVVSTRNSSRGSDNRSDSSAAGEKLKLEESVIKSSGADNTCRLRVRGNVVNEVTVPAGIAPGDDTKKFCDVWQRKEAATRGLL